MNKIKRKKLIIEKKNTLQGQNKYIRELFYNGRSLQHKDIIGWFILKSYVRQTLVQMKRNKTVGPDGIVIEMLLALDDLGTNKIIEIINVIYDSGEIRDDLN